MWGSGEFRGVENQMLSTWFESVARHRVEVKSNRTIDPESLSGN